MKILPKYIIREHIAPFVFALAVLMFLFLMNFLVKYITQIFGKGLSLITIIELIFYNLAWMFALAVPMAVLISTLMSFGRFSADNEITILKSSGISVYRIIRPALWFALSVTILMILFNDRVLPDFNHKARVMFRNIREKKPTLKLEPGIFFDIGKYSFMVEKMDKTLGDELNERTNLLGPEFKTDTKPDKLLNVLILDRSDADNTVSVSAEEGYMVYSTARKSIVFTLFDGEYHIYNNQNSGDYRFSHFSRNVVVINAPEFELENREDSYRGDREMNVQMMMDKVNKNRELTIIEQDKIKQRIEDRWKLINNRTGHITAMENPEHDEGDVILRSVPQKIFIAGLNQSQRVAGKLHNQFRTSFSRISSYQSTINRYLVEIHKKFSIPFSAIIFILVGAPLGIIARKGSLGVGATLSIFFFLIYWVGLILGEDLADRKLLTPMLAMWMPNLVIGFAGAYLTWRTVKETTFINWDRLKAIVSFGLKKKRAQESVVENDFSAG